MADFLSLLDMGKHTAYVWACYGFVGICLMGLIISLLTEGRSLKRAMIKEGLLNESK
ncbi:heme exporter protein CcmD [Ignatzschineria sp. LJL83]